MSCRAGQSFVPDNLGPGCVMVMPAFSFRFSVAAKVAAMAAMPIGRYFFTKFSREGAALLLSRIDILISFFEPTSPGLVCSWVPMSHHGYPAGHDFMNQLSRTSF